MAERRTREVGVRKVLGASVSGIVVLFVGDFTKWIMLANVIAWPAAWYITDQWLSGFAYRTEVGWQVFLSVVLSTLVLALLTVILQAFRAALTNPVDALQYE